jgi:hypothetical protein
VAQIVDERGATSPWQRVQDALALRRRRGRASVDPASAPTSASTMSVQNCQSKPVLFARVPTIASVMRRPTSRMGLKRNDYRNGALAGPLSPRRGRQPLSANRPGAPAIRRGSSSSLALRRKMLRAAAPTAHAAAQSYPGRDGYDRGHPLARVQFATSLRLPPSKGETVVLPITPRRPAASRLRALDRVGRCRLGSRRSGANPQVKVACRAAGRRRGSAKGGRLPASASTVTSAQAWHRGVSDGQHPTFG